MLMRITTWMVPVLLLVLAGCATREVAPPVAGGDADDPFLDTLQARTFRWFWETTNPANGLVPDRWPTRSFSSVAAVGFGLTAYGVGAERGYVTRDEAAGRTLTTLRFFWNAPQGDDPIGVAGHRGFFYHFLDMERGERFHNVELSTIDTALLMGGVLFARQYFDRDDPVEREIRALADSLYRRVEWDWPQPRAPLVSMGWYPDVGFHHLDYTGYTEAMLLYVLALGSPTYPIDEAAWDAFTETYIWEEFYGQEHLNFSPLFGHQYSHVWVDYRGVQDPFMREKGIDYFENSRRATLAQRAYAIANPGGWEGYGEDVWGLTACDGPLDTTVVEGGRERQYRTYAARGASAEYILDDGTIAPTAVGGSVPFAPEVTIPALKAMAERYGRTIYTEYGFLDAFNPTYDYPGRLQHGRVDPELGWYDTDYLGIDQGPILLMIENFRSGLVWEKMRQSPYIVRGLKRAGFAGGWLDEAPAPEPVSARPRDRRTFTQQAADETRIVVLGSSTAEGVGPEEAENTWVNRFRAYAKGVDPSVRVINLARGGYTTYHLLPTGHAVPEGRSAPDTLRNITQALARQPAAVIINLPSNDAAAGHTVAEQLRNYDVILAEARQAGVPVWITTTQPRNLDATGRQRQQALRDSTHARYGDRALDFWTGIARDDGTLDPAYDAGDNLHLNDEAHGLLFERVKAAGVLEAVLQRKTER